MGCPNFKILCKFHVRLNADSMEINLNLFFVTNIHGSDVCFRKFLNADKLYGADVLVLGGDINGKLLVPIVKQDDGSYSSGVFQN